MGSDGCLLDQTPLSTESTDIGHHAPPLYGEHILDQLYADMDQSGLMTPAPQSGMNTPFYSQSMSRAGSHENLAGLGQESHPTGAVPPSLLSSRLQSLNANSRNSSSRRLHGSGSNTPYAIPEGETPGYFDHANHSGNNSNVLSRRTSEEEHHTSNGASGYHTPEHQDYSALSKVPSYSTAIRSPARGISYNNALPDYNAATSAPPSPVQRYSYPTTPAEAHFTAALGSSTNPLSTLGFTPLHSPPAPNHGDVDEHRRLHMLRNR